MTIAAGSLVMDAPAVQRYRRLTPLGTRLVAEVAEHYGTELVDPINSLMGYEHGSWARAVGRLAAAGLLREVRDSGSYEWTISPQVIAFCVDPWLVDAQPCEEMGECVHGTVL